MKFTCARCGNCCRWPGYVRVSELEIDRIAGLLQLPVESFIAQYCRLTADRSGLSLTEQPDGRCIFLAESPFSCRIEQAKPGQCKAFPLEWNFPGWEKECSGSLK